MPGVDFELPANLQGWYDGRTTITLPSGRRVTPPANTYLRYNPDAFAGRVLTAPNGSIIADQFWYGNADLAYDEIRTDSRFNIDLSIRRSFRLSPTKAIDVGLDVMNVLNHTQFNGAYAGWAGQHERHQQSRRNGQFPGTASAANYGTRGMGDLQPAPDAVPRHLPVLGMAYRVATAPMRRGRLQPLEASRRAGDQR